MTTERIHNPRKVSQPHKEENYRNDNYKDDDHETVNDGIAAATTTTSATI
jgi:hypothetical protein